MAFLDLDDLNGECFVLGASGEGEQKDPSLLFHISEEFLKDFQQGSRYDQQSDTGKQHMQALLEETYKVNVAMLLEDDVKLAAEDARKVAYFRMLMLRDGLIEYADSPADHHCRYTLVEVYKKGQHNGLLQKHAAEIQTKIDDKIRKKMRLLLTNAICMVAYVFRVRGHHYIAGMDELYNNLFRRTLSGEDTFMLSWKLFARETVKVIFPDSLDRFWRQTIDEGKVAGTLVKRFDSLPAGSAGVGALYKGLVDLRNVFPVYIEKHQESFDYIEGIVRQIQDERWCGSINHSFYNQRLITVNESRIQQLAAVVLGALNTLAPQSPLRNSAALKRLADNSPLTGAFVTQMLMNAARKAGENTKMLIGPDATTE